MNHVLSKPTAVHSLVLYADVLSADFRKFHRFLHPSEDGNDRVHVLLKQFNYVIRLRPPVEKRIASTAFTLSGYGVELAVKNTEYKAMDDRNLHSNLD